MELVPFNHLSLCVVLMGVDLDHADRPAKSQEHRPNVANIKCEVRGDAVLRGTITEEGGLGRAATKMHSTSGERGTSVVAGVAMETMELKVEGGEETDHGICPRCPSPFPAYDIPA